ncbi:beta-lactamase family protein [Pseudoalteromonas luteoviolacea]|uniref:serine hydrolase domain-containing protein n=1 Tax=Pseudoalteromonas luteoviolacea TaxID=43657 RepID=UPI001F179C91|nr:serine hydrolase domain-containing protein [Pseudoalteromonas luteoviolacea]MCF6440593.1 beta-lactamase family protein [Pseudoalteromonas luteoviolacea]
MKRMKLINHIKTISITMATALLLTGPCANANANVNLDHNEGDNRLSQLLTDIEQVRTVHNIPAIGVAIVQQGQSPITQGFGYANKETNELATDRHLFRFGSVTKLLPGIAILQLQSKGLLALDDRLKDIAPSIQFKNKWHKTHPIQVQHLLEHTTGWDSHVAEQKALNDDSISLEQVLTLYPESRISRWAPGTREAYSNTGPTVAARVVEVLTGMRFSDYVNEYIFSPLSMKNSSLLKPKNWNELGAIPYLNNNLPVGYEYMATRPASSLTASMQDISKLLMLFLKPEQSEVLSPASVSRMQKIETELGVSLGLKSFKGFSHSKDIIKGQTFYGHNGGLPGVVSTFRYQPQLQMGFAIAMTKQNGPAYRKVKKLITEYLQLPEKVNHEPNLPLSYHFSDASGLYTQLNTSMSLGDIVAYFSNAVIVTTHKEQLSFKWLLGGYQLNYFQQDEQPILYNKYGAAQVAFAKDPIAGNVLVRNSKIYKKTPAWVFYAKLASLALSVIIVLSSLLYLVFSIPVNAVKKLLGRPKSNFIIWKALTLTASFIVTLTALPFILLSDYMLLNSMSWVSPLVQVCSILYPLLSFAAAAFCLQQCKKSIKSFVHYYLVSIVASHCVLSLFLMSYKLVNIQLAS